MPGKKSQRRENECGVVVGMKNTGKSTFLAEYARGYAKRTGKRVLIVDVNGAPAYAEFPKLSLTAFNTWNGDSSIRIAKIYESDLKVLFGSIAQRFRNGLLIIEDCTKYIDATPSREIKSILVDHRMWNVDPLFTFHAVSSIPPFFLKMINFVVLKKTLENFPPGAQYRYPFWNVLQKALAELAKEKDRYTYRIIQTGL